VSTWAGPSKFCNSFSRFMAASGKGCAGHAGCKEMAFYCMAGRASRERRIRDNPPCGPSDLALPRTVTQGAHLNAPVRYPDAVFKAYDIRGTVPQPLNEGFARTLGRALADQARRQGVTALVVGRD